MTAIFADSQNPAYSCTNGVLFTKSLGALIQYPPGKTTTNYVIPTGVSDIKPFALASTRRLSTVTIPDSVTNIGGAAFSNCTGLISVYFNGNAPSIGSSLFYGATNATIYYHSNTTGWGPTFGGLPTRVLYLLTIDGGSGSGLYTNGTPVSITASNAPTGWTFDQWVGATQYTGSAISSPTTVTMPDSNITITATYKLVSTSNFTCSASGNKITITKYTGVDSAVTIPTTIFDMPVAGIGNQAFQLCSQITSITIPNSINMIGGYAFYGCSGLTNVTIPDSVTTLGSNAFNSCTGLTDVTIGNGVSIILESTFRSCISLTNVLIPNSVTYIGWHAFQGCTNLASIAIPDSVTRIGSSSFWGCRLASVTVPKCVTNIEDNAFSSCTSLTNVTIPTSVTSIGDFAFSNCTSLARVTIPAGITNLGSGATQAGAMIFSQSIKSLVDGVILAGDPPAANTGNGAFYNCTNLTEVYFIGNAPAIGSDVFYGADNATIYYLPGTTGWGEMLGSRPTALWKPKIQTGAGDFGVQTNGFSFNINWADGMTVVVEACTNLASGIWVPVATNTLTGGSAQFSDPAFNNYPSRYYRVSMPQ